MVNYFLKAKHWQLFLLTFGLPFIIQAVMMATMFAEISSDSKPGLAFMPNFMMVFIFMMVVFIGMFFGWFWSVAIGLQKKLPEGVKMKVVRFKVFFFLPLLYLTLFLIIFGIALSGILKDMAPDETKVLGYIGIFILLHLFSMFCMFYILYFVAKTFKTAELQREVKFDDFVGEFFMIWFFPVGIWFIQPKINKMFEIENE